MTLLRTSHRPLTLEHSFSFYVSGRDRERIRECARDADAVVVCGAQGPASVLRLRQDGWQGRVLFDRAAYLARSGAVDPPRWFESQLAADADRLLTPGRWIGAEQGHLAFETQALPELVLAREHGATCVLCIDHRWLTRIESHMEMRRTLEGAGVPVALVLGNVGDPLARPGAVDGLVALTRVIHDLSILRCDHGAIGALAFSAAHGSIGLLATHRHGVPPAASARGKPHDQTARVFVWYLMDWFTAGTIAGWYTSKIALTCDWACCNGDRIDRFLDPRLQAQADWHNRNVLANLAGQILDIPEVGVRRRAFGQMCADAVDRYGVMGGLTTTIRPKPQLEQWAAYA